MDLQRVKFRATALLLFCETPSLWIYSHIFLPLSTLHYGFLIILQASLLIADFHRFHLLLVPQNSQQETWSFLYSCLFLLPHSSSSACPSFSYDLTHDEIILLLYSRSLLEVFLPCPTLVSPLGESFSCQDSLWLILT